MVQATLARWSRIDILVNVAGGAERKPVVEMTAADWDYVVDMNLKSAFLCFSSSAASDAPTKVRQDREHLLHLWFHRQRHPFELCGGESRSRRFHRFARVGGGQ